MTETSEEAKARLTRNGDRLGRIIVHEKEGALYTLYDAPPAGRLRAIDLAYEYQAAWALAEEHCARLGRSHVELRYGDIPRIIGWEGSA
ncbi:MAG: hypothetical protein AAF160_01935 [Pseudomonadota bacterium]